MCGFAAILNLSGGGAAEHAVDRMTRSISHRGPDQSGKYINGPVGLGFRRLSILDLSEAGNQPMISDCGRFVVVFNGEIFNYVELRHELQRLGHLFRSSGDTEVLLKAYQQWGSSCVARFNGMWAFLIYDRSKGVLFGSRDRFGMKPFYLHKAENYILYGSEIKAIRDSGLYKPATDWKTAANFLLRGELDVDKNTMYADIKQIAPGTWFQVDMQGHSTHQTYWSIAHIPRATIQDPPAEFAQLFADSVRLRMRSDVPVGVCLSGGLDSTSIICEMAALRNNGNPESGSAELLAFSFNTPEFDESRYLKDTLNQAQACLKSLDTDPRRLWDSIEKVLWYHDEPVHSMTALVGFGLMSLVASSGVKVILNGQGADEVFAGYPSYFWNHWYTLMRKGRMKELIEETTGYATNHTEDQHTLLLKTLIKTLFTEMGHFPLYKKVTRGMRHRRQRANSWFSPDLGKYLAPEDERSTDYTLSGELATSVARYALPLYLRIEDRNSMAHSIEARLPFLDHRLVEFGFNLPDEWKLRGPWNKYVMRQAMRNRIPDAVRTRLDKMGFPTPTKQWFKTSLHGCIEEVLVSQAARERGIYNIEAIRLDLERHKQGAVDVSGRLFDFAQFEMHMRTQNFNTHDCEVREPLVSA